MLLTSKNLFGNRKPVLHAHGVMSFECFRQITLNKDSYCLSSCPTVFSNFVNHRLSSSLAVRLKLEGSIRVL